MNVKNGCTGIEGPLSCENGSVPGFKKSILRFEAFKLSGKSPGGFAIITDSRREWRDKMGYPVNGITTVSKSVRSGT